MNCIEKLSYIYTELNQMKFNLFCKCNCNKNNYSLINDITFLISESKPFQEDNKHQMHCCNTIIDKIIFCVCEIEEINKCNKDYIYLSQLDKFKCLLINLKKILCQLKCLCHIDYCLLCKVVCIFIKILELILNIISKLNNIQCLINSHISCKCEILEYLICQLVEDLNELELNISNLAQLVLEITSQNIISCTTCTISSDCNNNCYNCKCKENCNNSLKKYDSKFIKY